MVLGWKVDEETAGTSPNPFDDVLEAHLFSQSGPGTLFSTDPNQLICSSVPGGAYHVDEVLTLKRLLMLFHGFFRSRSAGSTCVCLADFLASRSTRLSLHTKWSQWCMFVIPDDFVRARLAHQGEAGARWIQRLPTILATCEERWNLTMSAPFPNLSYHYVASATRADGSPVVVKVCSPTGEFAQESEALRLFAGHGMVQLLERDDDNEAMLLEALVPGILLSQVEDDTTATALAASVMRQLWRPVPAKHPFPTIADWGRGFVRLRAHYADGYGPFPPRILDEAETLFVELTASMDAPMLLHGDLHHGNMLAAQRRPWLAIDPKGLIGEPAYETGALLRNPLPQLLQTPQPGRVLARRIAQLAEELDLDRGRIRGWALAQAVLSAWWSVEDEGLINSDTIICAELLASLSA
jgi:streptomycin 6-kinase